MYNVLDVSRFIINYCNEKDYILSNLKLQKILYFIQAYYLSKTDNKEPCFKERIEAWSFGPVVPVAYHEYKRFGSTNIPKIVTFVEIDEENFCESKVVTYSDDILKDNDKELIRKLVDNFSKFSTTHLVQITHNQLPWIQAYKQGESNVITVEAIRSYLMDNNFESLLKTNTETQNVSQISDDALKYSKQKIRSICRNLCLPSNNYDPSKTVSAIKNYLSEKATKERILYSEISSYVYGLSEEQQGNFETNIENLLTYILDDSNGIDKDLCKIAIKIYDHFQLAISQKILNTEKNEIATASLVDKVEKANLSIEETSKRVKELEKEYITILGIFASIVLTFVGGLTFSTSVLKHINTISIYRLLLTVDLIAIVLFNVIYLLISFICHIINNRPFKPNTVLWFNIIFIIIGALIVFAWVLDFHSLVQLIRSWLLWT